MLRKKRSLPRKKPMKKDAFANADSRENGSDEAGEG